MQTTFSGMELWPYLISSQIIGADDFYEVSHSIVMGCWKRASMGDVITIDEVLDGLLDVEMYTLPNILKERRPCVPGMKKDRVTFGYGTSTKATLYSDLHDTNSPIRDEESRQGKHFRKDHGVPWQVFEDFVKTVDEKFSPRRGLRKLNEIPFELRVMVCFRHLCLGGPLNQHQASYSLDYSSFRKFFLESFLVWMEDKKEDYIQLPRKDAEINHVEILLRACGHPGAIGSIDFVHIGLHKCRYTLKVQCTNTGDADSKGKPSLVFQVVVSHTKKSNQFRACIGAPQLTVQFTSLMQQFMSFDLCQNQKILPCVGSCGYEYYEHE
jgi:hypothetical protein